MKSSSPFGLYLYLKSSSDHLVLKELLQFVKTVSPVSGSSFSYIEAETSLLPHLSLWENLQLESGHTNLRDFREALSSEQKALLNLIKEPNKKCETAEIWEKFLVSLLKGLTGRSKNLIVDMNEELFSPFLLQSFKKCVLYGASSKTVYLASANSSLWLDCAHSLVSRKEYEFEIQLLNDDMLKKHWIA